MAYPTVIYGPEGEQFNNYDSRRWPLGTRMVLQDGRRYAFVEAGGTALATGKVQQSEVPDADHDTLAVQAAAAVGARTISLTNGSDAIEANLYADGLAATEANAGGGEGYLYKIELTHASLAASATVSLPLAPGYGVQVALNTSDTVTLVKNPYADVIISGAPPAALIVGVATSPTPANNWGWVQTWGPTVVLIDGTATQGDRVSPCGTAGNSTAGAVEASGTVITSTAATAAQISELIQIGTVMETAPTTDYGLVFMTIS